MTSLNGTVIGELCLLSLSKEELREKVFHRNSVVSKTWRCELSKLNVTEMTKSYDKVLKDFIVKFARSVNRLVLVGSPILNKTEFANFSDIFRSLLNDAKKLKEIQISHFSRQSVNEFLIWIVSAKQKGWLERLKNLKILNLVNGMILCDLHLDLITEISIPWMVLSLSDVVLRDAECNSLENLLSKNSRCLSSMVINGIFPKKERGMCLAPLLVKIPKMQELKHLNLSVEFMKNRVNFETSSTEDVPVFSWPGPNEVPGEDANKSKKLVLRFTGDTPRLKSLILGHLVKFEDLPFSTLNNLHTFHCGSLWHETINFPSKENTRMYKSSLVTSLQLPDGLRDPSLLQKVAIFFPNIQKLTANLPSAAVVRAIFLHLSSSKLEELTLRTQYDFEYTLDTILFPGLIQSLDEATAKKIGKLKMCDNFKQIIEQFKLELPTVEVDPLAKGIADMKRLKRFNLQHIPRVFGNLSTLNLGFDFQTIFSSDISTFVSKSTYERLKQLPLEINLVAIAEKDGMSEDPLVPQIVSVISNAIEMDGEEGYFNQSHPVSGNGCLYFRSAESNSSINSENSINRERNRTATVGHEPENCFGSEDSSPITTAKQDLTSNIPGTSPKTAESSAGSHRTINLTNSDSEEFNSLTEIQEDSTHTGTLNDSNLKEELNLKTENTELFMDVDDFQYDFRNQFNSEDTSSTTHQIVHADVIVTAQVNPSDRSPPEDVLISSDEDEVDADHRHAETSPVPKRRRRTSKKISTKYNYKDEYDLDYINRTKIQTKNCRPKTRQSSYTSKQLKVSTDLPTSQEDEEPIYILSLSSQDIRDLQAKKETALHKSCWEFDCSTEIAQGKNDILFSLFKRKGATVQRLQWINSIYASQYYSKEDTDLIKTLLKFTINLKEITLSNVCDKTVNIFHSAISTLRDIGRLRSLDSFLVTDLHGSAVLDKTDLQWLSMCEIPWRKLELGDFNLDEDGWSELENLLQVCIDTLEYFKIHGGIDPDYPGDQDRFTPFTLTLPWLTNLEYLFVSLRFQQQSVAEIKALRPTEVDFIPIAANVFEHPSDVIIKLTRDLPKLRTLILGNRVVIDELPFSVIRKLEKFECGSQWNLNTCFPKEESRTVRKCSLVTCLQLPDGLQDPLFVSKIPKYFRNVTKITFNIPSAAVLRSFFSNFCDLNVENLVLRTQFDFEGTLESILFPDLEQELSEASKETIAAIKGYRHFEKFVRVLNVHLPTEFLPDKMAKGIKDFKSLKQLHLEHVKRKLPVPSPGEQKFWWDQDFISNNSPGLTTSNFDYPLTTACHEKLKTLSCKINLKSFK